MLTPFCMLTGQIERVHELALGGVRAGYVERTYEDETGARAVVILPADANDPPREVSVR